MQKMNIRHGTLESKTALACRRKMRFLPSVLPSVMPDFCRGMPSGVPCRMPRFCLSRSDSGRHELHLLPCRSVVACQPKISCRAVVACRLACRRKMRGLPSWRAVCHAVWPAGFLARYERAIA